MLTYLSSSCETEQQTLTKDIALELWYDQPAQDWMTEALPIGNAFMGGMIFGQPKIEHIQFSEESLWAGGPRSDSLYAFGNRSGAHYALGQVRELLATGRLDEAHKLANKELTGQIHKGDNDLSFGDYGAHQTMGDLYIEAEGVSDWTNYRRALSLDSAMVTVQFSTPNNYHSRNFFCLLSSPCDGLHFQNKTA